MAEAHHRTRWTRWLALLGLSMLWVPLTASCFTPLQRPNSAALTSPGPPPDFTLADETGKTYRLADLLRQGPLVLVFYRGYW